MEVIIGIVFLIGVIMVLRLLGAWMLRIDEVIKNQKEMISLLKNISNTNSDS